MPRISVDFDLPRNGDLVRDIQLITTDLSGNETPINLTGYTVSMDARDVGGGTVLASAVIAIVAAENGLIRMTWRGADFDEYGSQFDAVRVAYDLLAIALDGTRDVPMRGQLILLPEVTS